MAIQEGGLDFIVKVTDQGSSTLNRMTDSIADHADSHTDLSKAAGASGQALNDVADASVASAAAHGLAADAAEGSAASIDKIGDSAEVAQGKFSKFVQAVLGVTSADQVVHQFSAALTGVSTAAFSIKTETLTALGASLEGLANKDEILTKIKTALNGVNTESKALKAVGDVLNGAGVANASAMVADLTTHLSTLTPKTEEASVAGAFMNGVAQQVGVSTREWRAEAGLLGEVLGEFGVKGAIVAAGVGLITAATAEGIHAFSDYQQMVERFQTNQVNSGRSMSFNDLHETSEQISGSSTFNADQLDEAGVKIAQFTDLSSQDIKMVMKDAADVAAGTGQNIEAIAERLGMAFSNPLQGAERLRLLLPDVTAEVRTQLREMDAAGDFEGERELINEKVQEMYGGQAAAMQATLGGSFDVLGHGIAEVTENGLAAVGALISAFTPLQAIVLGLGQGLEAIGGTLGDIKEWAVLHDGSLTSNMALATQNAATASADAAADSAPNAGGRYGALMGTLARDQAARDAANAQDVLSLGGHDRATAYWAQANLAGDTAEANGATLTRGMTDGTRKLIEAQGKALEAADKAAIAAAAEQNAEYIALGKKSAASSYNLSDGSTLADAETLRGNALDKAESIIPDAKKIDDLNESISIFEKAIKGTSAAGEGGKAALNTFNESLGILKSQLADTGSAITDLSLTLARAAQLAGAVGGDKDLLNFQNQYATAYLKTPDGAKFEPGVDDNQRQTDAANTQAAHDYAMSKQYDLQTQTLSAQKTQFDDTSGYLKAESSRDPSVAASAKAAVDAITAAIKAGGQTGFDQLKVVGGRVTGTPTDSSGRIALEAFTQTQQESLLTNAAAEAKAGPDATDKKYDSITDVTASATAYNKLLADGNVTLGQAKEYQEAYTTAQQLSADGEVSFSAALTKTIALIKERTAATLDSANAEKLRTNQQDAAVNAMSLSSGPQAAARLKAQQEAANADYTPGTSAYNEYVSNAMTTASNTADHNANDQIQALNEQIALLSAPQTPIGQANAKIAYEGANTVDGIGGASQEDLAKLTALTDAQIKESAAVAASTQQHQAWNSIVTNGFQGVDTALVNVIMRTQTWGQAFGSVAKDIANQLASLIIQQELIMPLERSLGLGGAVSGATGGAGGLFGLVAGGISSLFGSSSSIDQGLTSASFAGGGPALYASGGISGPDGPIPLKMYAAGGVALNGPQMSVFGEAGPEAYVPLADGRSIPVTVQGATNAGSNSSPVNNHFNVQVLTGAAPSGATPQQHAAMVGAEVSRQMEALVVKAIQNQQRSGGILA